MLPEELSNEMCSLKADVDRLCMVCDMEITASGAIKGYKFYPAVMHSRARLTYTQVWEWLDAPAKANTPKARALLPHLANLYALYTCSPGAGQARRHRLRHGRAVPGIRRARQDHAHRAQPSQRRAQADRGMHAGGQRLHRGVPGRAQARRRCTACTRAAAGQLVVLREFLKTSALQFGGGERARRRRTTRNCSTRSACAPISTCCRQVLLRSLSQAQYRPENEGHFGLAYEAYTHFTSPIRRYPDLLVHRAIKAVLAGKRYTPSGMTWEELGEHTSMTERRADDASRDVTNWLKCHFMQDKIGEEFDGTISGVTSSGCSSRWTDSTSTASCTSPSWAATISISMPEGTR